jgi:hypothetical protein
MAFRQEWRAHANEIELAKQSEANTRSVDTAPAALASDSHYHLAIESPSVYVAIKSMGYPNARSPHPIRTFATPPSHLYLRRFAPLARRLRTFAAQSTSHDQQYQKPRPKAHKRNSSNCLTIYNIMRIFRI